MAQILRVDTNGIKGLLGQGELGYDGYAAGGDEGRVYVGKGAINIPLSTKAEVTAVDDRITTEVGTLDDRITTEVDTLDGIIADIDAAVGTSGGVKRYDKILGSLDVLEMDYTSGDLDFARYVGDNGVNVFYRDVMTYVDGTLASVKHYYNKTSLVTPSATTTLTYDVDGNLVTAAYVEA